MKILIIQFFITTLAFGYKPTLESLLKNNNNPELLKPSVMVSLEVSKGGDKKYLQDVLLYSGNSGLEITTRLTDLTGNVLGVKSQSLFEQSVMKNNPIRSFYFTVLTNQLLNNSQVLLNFLKVNDVSISKSSEKVNKQKITLMEKYRKFLERKRKDPSYDDKNSPLYSTDKEEMKKRMKLFNQDYYLASEKSQLTKRENKIFWLIDKGDFKALYDSNTRELSEISIKNSRVDLEMKFFNYMSPDNKHKFPGKMVVRFNDELYEMKLKSYEPLSINGYQGKKRNFLGAGNLSDDIPEFLRLN